MRAGKPKSRDVVRQYGLLKIGAEGRATNHRLWLGSKLTPARATHDVDQKLSEDHIHRAAFQMN